MKNMIEQALAKMGLTDKEIKVYLAALELGKASVQEVSRKSGINRATTYVQLEQLVERGLVSIVDKDKKNIVVAERPQRIIDILENKKSNIDDLKKQFSGLMPQLEAIYNVVTDRPQVKFYEGEAGLKLVRADIIKSKPEMVCAIIPGRIEGEKEVMEYMAKNLKFFKIVFVGEKNFQHFNPNYKNGEARHHPLANFDVDITLYSNKVFLNKPVATDENMGVLIEDKLFFQSFLAIFDLLWQTGTPWK